MTGMGGNEHTDVAAVVLAAGGGRRYGMPKALVEYEGSLLVERAVRTARAVCDPVLVVLGAQAVDVWRQADLDGATVLANQDWETGMASSLRTGLDGLRGWPGRVDAALVTLVDMPGMTPEALGRMPRTRRRRAGRGHLRRRPRPSGAARPRPLGRGDRDADRRRGRPPLPGRARRHRGRLHGPGRSDRPRRPAGRSTFGAVIAARVVDEPLSVAEHEDAVADKAAGAVVSFAGVVRDHDGGRSVTELEYVGHPTAAEVIARAAPRSSPPGPTCTPSPCRTGSDCSASATSRWPARSAPPTAARRSPPARSSSTR